MPAAMPKQDFEAMIRRAGLSLSPDQVAELYRGWAYVEPMLERVRGPGPRGREAEPALIWQLEQP